MGRRNQRTGRQMVGCVRLLQARRSRNWAEVSESDDGVALAAIYDRRSNLRWSGSPSGSHTPFGNLIRLLKFCFIYDLVDSTEPRSYHYGKSKRKRSFNN